MYNFFKRILDIIGGTILFLISLPIILITAVIVRIETKGSPFFFQTRIGLRGKPFKIFKLRGMYIDSRERFPDLYDYSANTSLDFHFHYEDDPRVTKTGRIIRKYSIDELPNLFNVIIGDMSLVGPRPEIPDILQKYEQFKDEYISVKPGVTCSSKITGRDTLTKLETIEQDLIYIRTRSLKKDIHILFTTCAQVISKKNVY